MELCFHALLKLMLICNRIANYEVSGSIRLTLACQQDIGSCLTNATSQDSKFTSIQPVRDPTL